MLHSSRQPGCVLFCLQNIIRAREYVKKTAAPRQSDENESYSDDLTHNHISGAPWAAAAGVIQCSALTSCAARGVNFTSAGRAARGAGRGGEDAGLAAGADTMVCYDYTF